MVSFNLPNFCAQVLFAHVSDYTSTEPCCGCGSVVLNGRGSFCVFMAKVCYISACVCVCARNPSLTPPPPLFLLFRGIAEFGQHGIRCFKVVSDTGPGARVLCGLLKQFRDSPADLLYVCVHLNAMYYDPTYAMLNTARYLPVLTEDELHGKSIEHYSNGHQQLGEL
ncbi:CUGBP Elav family member 4 isoform X9 [Biomphalaria glabrata]|nr:CUGBP Elav family member 4 isoform X9 [Biomphalaria glabrata]